MEDWNDSLDAVLIRLKKKNVGKKWLYDNVGEYSVSEKTLHKTFRIDKGLRKIEVRTEAIAETFAIVTDPLYKTGQLPKELEDFVYRMIGVK